MRRRRAARARLALLAAALTVGGPARGQPEAEAPAAPPAETLASDDVRFEPPAAGEIARRAAGVLRGPQTYLEATLIVKRSGLSRRREIVFRCFDDRRNDRTLVRILSPEKHAGTAILKLPPNLWRWTPDDGETRRLAWSELGEPWMKSAFLHDDVLHGSSELRDYDHRLLGVEEDAGESGDRHAFVLESVARAGSPAAWGRIVAWIDVEHATPLRRDFYAGDGALARTLTFGDVREVGGRRFPHLWVAVPSDGEGREARIRVDAVRFEPSFDEAIFATRSLGPAPQPPPPEAAP